MAVKRRIAVVLAGALACTLAALLWPDAEESLALYYLRRSLSNLRHALGAVAPVVVFVASLIASSPGVAGR